MKVRRIDHVGVNVNDLAAAKAFFVDFGLEVQSEGELEGEWLDRIVGLKNVKTGYIFMQTADGGASVELIKYYSPSDEKGIQPSSANTLGYRHVAFVVDDIAAIVAKLKKRGTEVFGEVYQYEDSFKLCYCRGPEGIIVELAEQLN